MRTRRRLSLVIVAFSLSALSCEWPATKNYNVDKTSPNGTYRVKVEVRVKDEGWGAFTEQGKIQIFKGQEVIDGWDWKRKDTWEPTFIEAHPIIEWVGDDVLRMGRDRSNQPLLDEFVVKNDTDEHIKYAGITYSKYESLQVFDVAPGKEVTLLASPEFNPDGSSNDSYGYGGMALDWKKFAGVGENKQRRSPAEGKLKIQITINSKDLTVATKDE